MKGMRTVQLSDEAAAVVAGLVNGSHINADGIIASDEAWAEIRGAFPEAVFTAWAEAHDVERDGVGYDPDAGL